MSHVVLSARHLTKTYPARRRRSLVFRDLELTTHAEEMLAITGPSGSGKSTLLHCLAALEPLDTGDIDLMGTRLTGRGTRATTALRRAHMGFIFQEYNLIESLTARQNIHLAARLSPHGHDRHAIDAILDRVDMTHRADAYPSQLSGGQQQRIAVARTLAARPDIVFADEPTGALDAHNAHIVLDGLHQLAHNGSSIVLVTHDPQAAQQADRTVTLTQDLLT